MTDNFDKKKMEIVENIIGSPLPVSVIIPVHNGESYLPEAIESILNQSYQEFELVIIDDGSKDRTHQIALSYPRVTYYYQEHNGTASARNMGIRKSQGEYIAFLDADDLWLPDKLALQIKAFNQDPKLEIVTGCIEQFISPRVDQVKNQFAFIKRPLIGYSTSAIMIKRTALNKTGFFHEDYQEGETISWFANFLDKDINILILPEVIAKRRIHGENLSLKDQSNNYQTMLRILKKKIDNQRVNKGD